MVIRQDRCNSYYRTATIERCDSYHYRTASIEKQPQEQKQNNNASELIQLWQTSIDFKNGKGMSPKKNGKDMSPKKNGKDMSPKKNGKVTWVKKWQGDAMHTKKMARWREWKNGKVTQCTPKKWYVVLCEWVSDCEGGGACCKGTLVWWKT